MLKTSTTNKDMVTLHKLLVKYEQLDLGYRNNFGKNILHYYLDEFANDVQTDEAIKIVKLFIDSGFSVYDVGTAGTTPLFYSIDIFNVELVSFLIDNVADVNRMNDCGEFLLILAVEYSSEDIVSLLLLNGADVNSKNHFRISAVLK